ncbi:carbonic anhydrase [Acetobacteraceae bacterium KSS8]|uniref:Carbonic anhydrase n=1 Tax=Endosaccharibacter trunci TaxID=2812733 RepID=A0ABT1W7X0_9PROT|nr:carbonic anhydrase [Acetobacteraceae bacterium KSS8]
MTAPHPPHDLLSLLEGVQDFSTRVYPEKRDLFDALAQGQAPHTLLITCADSRISPELITQSEPGTLFVLRNIGNIVPPYGEMLGGVSAAIEYAVLALGVRNIIVCGHSDCGAMKALLDPASSGLDAMPTVSSWLRHADAAHAVCEALHHDANGADKLQAVAEHNVLLQIDHLRTHPAVAARVADGRLTLMGWLYDIPTGTVRVFDGASREARAVPDVIEMLRAGA